MTWQGRIAILAIFVLAELLMGGVLPPWAGLPLLALAAVIAWRRVPRFWRMLVGGLVGGAIAGVLILGPGFRVAMRAVAMMEPSRATEFTIGGTLFIVLGIGLMLGSIQGLTSHTLRRVLGIRSHVLAGSLLGAFFVGQLVLFSGDISDEFFDLGAGAWVNIPLFGVIAVAYGIAAMALADKFEVGMFAHRRIEREKVPA